MNWTDEYRDIIEFYYWEPQHLGRAKGIKRFDNVEQMWEHVDSIEVSLNHILNIFFSLYSNKTLFSKLGVEETYDYVSSRQVELWVQDTGGFTQPDMFFTGDNSNLAIELKLAAKTSLEQIAKYIIFNHKISQNKRLNIVFLTPYNDLEKITKEKLKTNLEITRSLEYSKLSKNLQSNCNEQDYKAIVENTTISIISLSDFKNILVSLVPQNSTEDKLLSGTIDLLNNRGF